MIKRTLYFGNPAYLSMRNAQLVVHLPEVVKNNDLPESFKKRSTGYYSYRGYWSSIARP